MKTFETEKNYIPEGATHYSDERQDYCFAWYKDVDGTKYLWVPGDFDRWDVMYNQSDFYDDGVKPIPKPEVVEWNGEGLPPVGVECEAVFIEHESKGYGEFLVLDYHSDYVWMEYVGELSNKSKHYTAKVDLVKFRKPESPEEKEKRERLEAAYDLYCHVSKKANRGIYTFEQFCDESLTDYKIDYLAIIDKTNYRKGE